MNKFLTSSLIAATAVVTPNAFSETCSQGGFYIGVSAGLALNKAKVSPESHPYVEGESIVPGAKQKIASASEASKIGPDLASDVSVNIAKTHKVSKRKASFLAEVVLGYDHRFNDVMMGVDLAFGMTFGKQKLKSKQAVGMLSTTLATPASLANPARVFAKIKRQWHVSFMPRVGYLFTPQFEGYVTAGVKWQKMKYQTYKHGFAYLDARVHNTDFDNFYDSADIPPYYKQQVKKGSLLLIPVVGIGIRYTIMPELYTKLEYNYEFTKRLKMPKDGIIECRRVNVGEHVVKLGLGYKF